MDQENIRALVALDVVQRQHTEWAITNFGYSPGWQPLLGLQEELGELSHSYLKREQNIRMDEDHDSKIEDAIGDIVLFLMHFCSTQDLKLSTVLWKVFETVNKRTWPGANIENSFGDEKGHWLP